MIPLFFQIISINECNVWLLTTEMTFSAEPGIESTPVPIHVFPQSLQINVGILILIKPRYNKLSFCCNIIRTDVPVTGLMIHCALCAQFEMEF
jgi:hypothetical protein